jgi:hypothetical protein
LRYSQREKPIGSSKDGIRDVSNPVFQLEKRGFCIWQIKQCHGTSNCRQMTPAVFFKIQFASGQSIRNI